jgi:DoxX-like family
LFDPQAVGAKVFLAKLCRAGRKTEGKRMTKMVAYWAVTVLIALETFVGGVADLVHGRSILVAGPPVADVVTHLGYPLCFLRIIGFWKLLGAIALLVPGYPRLKEWAYAGIFFELSGAAASWLACEHNVGEAVAPMMLALLTLVSWALRPQHRLLGVLVPGLNAP